MLILLLPLILILVPSVQHGHTQVYTPYMTVANQILILGFDLESGLVNRQTNV
jgi:hypothetical protein